MVIETNSPEDTMALGEKIGQNAKPGEIYTLIGDLGVGKTLFAQGFAKGIGCREYVNSPTFTILQVYDDGRLPLYHFDVYRIDDPEEMYEVGLDEYIFGNGVSLIEWADMIKDMIPEGHTRIEIEKNTQNGYDYRKITITKAD